MKQNIQATESTPLLLQAVFDTQRWRASPVWLLYNLLRAIQFNVHQVYYVLLTCMQCNFSI